jgi:hypothetical protein
MTEEHQQDEAAEDGATAFVMSLFTKDGPDLSGNTPASRMNVQMIAEALEWAREQQPLPLADREQSPTPQTAGGVGSLASGEPIKATWRARFMAKLRGRAIQRKLH